MIDILRARRQDGYCLYCISAFWPTLCFFQNPSDERKRIGNMLNPQCFFKEITLFPHIEVLGFIFYDQYCR